ncbi:hypothetical protein TrLO_g8273 [Triparma laevis f. longispina]|uniref:Uncharacterized protein n=1 Tax=Triparma laevis f. longispina TaxID=1714387 RepID=A0A9W7FAP6_9STRA|nr:hypothetical protein TrLO_g8273 [Triparma laevis f. longispina]
MTVAGNHDLWVCGGPSCGDKFDQFGVGMMQYYAQDTVGSVTFVDNDFANFEIDPDSQDSGWDTFVENNKAENFL